MIVKNETNETFPRGILEALFLDEDATAVKITSLGEDKKWKIDVCQVDFLSPMFIDLMKLTNLEDIEKDTIENTKLRVDEQTRFESFERSDEETYNLGYEAGLVEGKTPIRLSYLTENFNLEDLFKLKLEIFETDIIKNKTTRVQRSSIRKAENPLRLIGLYYTILNDIEKDS